MSEHDFWITVRGPREVEFLAVFGTARLPVRSPLPELASLPGKDGPQLVYQLAVDRISAEQRARLCAHLGEKFGYAPAFVDLWLDEEGMPILADADTTITVYNPQRWIT